MSRLLFRLTIVISLAIAFPKTVFSQWSGFETGMYSGLHSLNLNPAAIAGSPFKYDVNFISPGITYFDRNFETDVDGHTFQTGGIFKRLDRILSVENANTIVFTNSMLPALSYAINRRMAIAGSMNVRGYVVSTTSSSVLRNVLMNDLSGLDGEEFTNEFIHAYAHLWVDYKFSYAAVVMNREDHQLKIGIGAKLLQGIASARIEVNDLSFRVTGDLLEYAAIEADILYNENVDNLSKGEAANFGSGRIGGAVDLGIQYEYRPAAYRLHETLGYKMRAGIALGDIGGIRYKAGSSSSVINASAENVSLDFLENISSLDALMDSLDRIFNYDKERPERYSTITPLTLRLNFDYNFGRNFYLNIQNNYAFLKMATESDQGLKNQIILRATARYEDKRFGVYLPVTYHNSLLVNAGISLRWKAFVVGSDNILTTWFYPREKQVLSLFLAIKAPILDMQFRDVGSRRRVRKAAESES